LAESKLQLKELVVVIVVAVVLKKQWKSYSCTKVINDNQKTFKQIRFLTPFIFVTKTFCFGFLTRNKGKTFFDSERTDPEIIRTILEEGLKTRP